MKDNNTNLEVATSVMKLVECFNEEHTLHANLTDSRLPSGAHDEHAAGRENVRCDMATGGVKVHDCSIVGDE